MSEVKNRVFALAEQLAMSPAQLLNEINGGMPGAWRFHRANHSLSPSPNCDYCVQDADIPSDMEVLDNEEDDTDV